METGETAAEVVGSPAHMQEVDAREQSEKQGGGLVNIVVSGLGSRGVVETVEALFGPAQRVTETGSVWDLRERAEQF